MSQDPVPPTPPSPQDPNADFYNYLEQWNAINDQWSGDMKTLQASLLSMLKLMKDPGAALLYAELNVLPNLMTAKADQVGTAGSTENLSSGLREFMTNMQNLFNKGSSFDHDSSGKPIPGSPDAQKLLTLINQLNALLNDPKATAALSPDTIADLKTSLSTLTQTLGTTTTSIDAAMSKMFPQPPPPTPTPPTPPTPPPTPPPAPTPPSFDPDITQCTNAFQELGADVSSMAATATSREQYLTNVYNQLQGVLSGLYQSSATLEGALVQAQKTS